MSVDGFRQIRESTPVERRCRRLARRCRRCGALSCATRYYEELGRCTGCAAAIDPDRRTARE